MSVSVTTVNGLIVVTQVFPQGEEMKIPITAAIAQAKAKTVKSVQPASPMSAMTRVFVRGQPKPLGIVQIFIGLLTMALGIVSIFANMLSWCTPLWTGAIFVLSGTFSVVAHKGTRAGLIRGTLALNLLSAIFAVAGVVVCCLSLINSFPRDSGCERDTTSSSYNDDDDYYWNCQQMFWKYNVAMDGITGLLLTLAVLEFFFALTGTIFAGKASCSSSSSDYGQPAVVAEKADLQDVDSLYGSDVGLLDGGGDAPGNPPPYDA